MTAQLEPWQSGMTQDAHQAATTAPAQVAALRNSGVRDALYFIAQRHRAAYSHRSRPVNLDSAYEVLAGHVERQARLCGIRGVHLPHREELHHG